MEVQVDVLVMHYRKYLGVAEWLCLGGVTGENPWGLGDSYGGRDAELL